MLEIVPKLSKLEKLFRQIKQYLSSQTEPPAALIEAFQLTFKDCSDDLTKFQG